MHTLDRLPTRGRAPGVARVLFAALLAATTLPASVEARLLPFTAILNAPQENHLASSGQGLASCTFDTQTLMLCYAISYQGLGGTEVLAHFHGPAAPGQTAGVLFDISPMPPGPSPVGSPKIGCVGPLGSDHQRFLKKGLLYINIHTTLVNSGEIRGQVYPVKGIRY
jgi:hypothetical protein